MGQAPVLSAAFSAHCGRPAYTNTAIVIDHGQDEMLLSFHTRRRAAQESGATENDWWEGWRGGAGDMVHEHMNACMCHPRNSTTDILPVAELYMGMFSSL